MSSLLLQNQQYKREPMERNEVLVWELQLNLFVWVTRSMHETWELQNEFSSVPKYTIR